MSVQWIWGCFSFYATQIEEYYKSGDKTPLNKPVEYRILWLGYENVAFEKLQFTMNDIAHWVQPGHRLMVQIQSSWFPLVNMNPQKFMDNIYMAKPEDYQKSEVTIYHQKDLQSRILLPVM